MEENNLPPETAKKPKVWLWVIIILIILAVAGAVYYLAQKPSDSGKDSSTKSNSGPVSIPQKVLDNKFGWLGGGAEDDGDMISESGGAWARPHPGAFLWDAMQKSADGKIDFSGTDEEISNFQKNNLGVLVTIWPFADWDQQTSPTSADCAVSDSDEFLIKNDTKGRGAYLPSFRCNPIDWTSYQTWVGAIVERYDGDGIDDMPGLTMPVKYWEVMNEPDLNYQSNLPASESDRLNFYKQGPDEYGELLKQTYTPIKDADSEANVLIAGAAGGDSRMLGFYQKMFADTQDASNYFDIGNVHCISNDEQTHDFNVTAYKKMLADAGISAKPVWVTEAEAFYPTNTTADQNYQSTQTSVAGALAAGAERIFFTRYSFYDFRSDMSDKTTASSYPSSEKYLELIEGY